MAYYVEKTFEQKQLSHLDPLAEAKMYCCGYILLLHYQKVRLLGGLVHCLKRAILSKQNMFVNTSSKKSLSNL